MRDVCHHNGGVLMGSGCLNFRPVVECHSTVTNFRIAEVDVALSACKNQFRVCHHRVCGLRLTTRWTQVPAGFNRCDLDYRVTDHFLSFDSSPWRCLVGGSQLTQDQGKVMYFRGRDRKDVKRKILIYWANHSGELGLSLREFLANCRMGPNERTIVYTAPQS